MSTVSYPGPYFNPESIFYQHYEATRRDEVVGVLLALFLGGFGVHHFYLRRIGLGILYLCFSWTPLPWVLGFIECFFMPARVREFNAVQAAAIAAALGIPLPAGWGYPIPGAYAQNQAQGQAQNYAQSHYVQTTYSPAPYSQAPGAVLGVLPAAPSSALLACPNCHTANPPGSRFCGSCGTSL
jgi:TM2 domain-containing membrane protein YozV